MIDERPEPQRLGRRRRRRRLRALENVGNAQRQLARLEWLRHVIVGAELKPGDAAFRRVPRSQDQHRHRRGLADRLDQIETALARHHHVENEQIEIEPGQPRARIGGAFRRGDAIAFAVQVARQQAADAPVVVDDQQMRCIVGRRRERRHGRVSHSPPG